MGQFPLMIVTAMYFAQGAVYFWKGEITWGLFWLCYAGANLCFMTNVK